ncbi:SRPBCC family protein [Streptomyces sp. NPDC053427]|uniref:SRPBCC family protein n=1 Tax=Streptomyces sp. NPDC053427 TaxID=3365701 RepID=UPI0037D4572D
MQLTHTVPVNATPDEVFALMNDVRRVASCMPGASLDGRDGDSWQGRVTVRVGPITAAYAGSVRFLEADAGRRRLRVQARGADTHGRGDAEAEVTLTVAEAPEGARLELSTDLIIRGKLAQFGKGAIGTVSDRILEQFARNLGGLLAAEDGAGGTAVAPVGAPAPASAPASGPAPELDGLSLLAGPALAKYGPLAAAFAFGVFEGWLLGRLHTLSRQVKEARRA